MSTTYQLDEEELDEKFLASLKSLYAKKRIEIHVAEVDGDYHDETEYLMSSEANREHLLQSVKNIESGEHLISVNLEDVK